MLGSCLWVQPVQYELFSVVFFLNYCSLSILLLPLLWLGSESICLSPGFCVCSPRKYDLLGVWSFWDFFVPLSLIVWADEVNVCGCCLAGDMECWIKGPQQIPSVSLLFYCSFHFYIYEIFLFVPGLSCPLYCSYKWWWDGIGVCVCWGGRWFIIGYASGAVGGYHLIVFAFFVLLHIVLSCSQSFYLGSKSMMAALFVSLLVVYFLCFWCL